MWLDWLEDDLPLWHTHESTCAGCYQEYVKYGATTGCTFCKRLAGYTVIEFKLTEVHPEVLDLLFGVTNG